MDLKNDIDHFVQQIFLIFLYDIQRETPLKLVLERLNVST